MKKHNLAEFFKSKSFYALLCVGALAIVVITMVGLNQASVEDKNNKLADLNDPIVSDVANGEDISNQEIGLGPDTNNQTSSTAANNEEGTSQTEVAQGNPDQEVTDGSLLEFDIYDDPQGIAASKGLNPENTASNEGVVGDTATTQTAEAGENNTSAEANAGDVVAPEQTASNSDPVEETKAVMKPEDLYFEAEDGLLWPVTGNILMNYSADRVIYHATLEQFKCNPAVIIDAEVGTEVLSAAKGIITSITDEDETGLTITASIGNGFSLVYGQLQDDVKFEVGDIVDEGEVLGTIAEPSKYYSVEGSNLYFQVMKDEDTVNPMLLLR